MEKTFLAPRQFKIVVFQFFGLLLLLSSILMLIATLMSLINKSPKDVLIGSVITIPLLLLGSVIIYVCQTYIGRAIVDQAQNLLIIKKRGLANKTYDLNEISRFILTELIFPMPGFREIRINAEIYNGIVIELISDDIVLFGRNWTKFSEELASVANKPLKKDTLVEHLDGKLSSK